MTGGLSEAMLTLSTWALPVVIAITLHEAAHGYVAHKLGDDTAKMMGRVSFNPLRHVDTFGTIIMPLLLFLLRAPFLFGYAKPVPVNFARLRNPRSGMVWVALAGPGINFAIAILSGVLLHLTPFFPDFFGSWYAANLVNMIQFNLLIAIFNLIPIPPLDGGRVAVGLLPRPLARPLASLEPYGMLILLGLLLLLPMLGGVFGQNWNVFSWIVLPPLQFLFTLILQFIVGA